MVDILNFGYTASILALMLYGLAIIIRDYWGRKQQTLYFVSYMAYNFPVQEVVAFCFISRFRFIFGIPGPIGVGAGVKKAIQEVDFIAERLFFLQTSKNCRVLQFRYLVLFIIWPLLNSVAQIVYDYAVIQPKRFSFFDNVTRFTTIYGLFFYGCYCYLMFVERKSFQWEFNMIAHSVLEGSSEMVDKLDECRQRIAQAHNDMRSLREHIGIWMGLGMSMTTLGLVAHATWSYQVYTRCDFTACEFALRFFDLHSWSKILMFYLLPYFACGGLNIEYIWYNFQYTITSLRKAGHEKFWHGLRAYLKDIDYKGRAIVKSSLLFSVFGLFLGFQIMSDVNQELNFGGLVVNCTSTGS